MKSNRYTPSSIDEYISGFPYEIQEILQNIRKIMKDASPDATEKISYQMPTFYLNGNLVHFAAFKQHIGFFPTPSGVAVFRDKLSDYKISKGTIQFPFGKPIPYDLITEIVKYRTAENLKIAEQKRKSE